MPSDFTSSGAQFDRTGGYRYRLWRTWGDPQQVVVFVMLNPSSADAQRLDPTTTRCAYFAERWGYGGFEAVNLFALRTADPRELRSHPDPVGPGNDRQLAAAMSRAALLIFAWGNHGRLHGRDQIITRRLARLDRQAYCFGLTGLGQPRHPLYLPAQAELVAYPGVSGAPVPPGCVRSAQRS